MVNMKPQIVDDIRLKISNTAHKNIGEEWDSAFDQIYSKVYSSLSVQVFDKIYEAVVE